jgi:heat-inducible transcriptional repressor
MARLEDEGYIAQPYTSAGRIPTEKAYMFYLNNLTAPKIKKQDKDFLDKELDLCRESGIKSGAKALSKVSGNAVFWAIHRHNIFYTGISNLLQQPEFSQSNLIYDISAVIDRIDEIIEEIFDQLEYGSQILVGSNNPFGVFCSSIINKYKYNGNIGVFGILAPLRMDYEKNLAIVNYINEKLKK